MGAGELTGADFAVTGTLDIKLGAGDIDLEGGTYKDIKLDCGMGSFALDGIVAEKCESALRHGGWQHHPARQGRGL